MVSPQETGEPNPKLYFAADYCAKGANQLDCLPLSTSDNGYCDTVSNNIFNNGNANGRDKNGRLLRPPSEKCDSAKNYRKYVATVTAADSAGNQMTSTCSVVVVHEDDFDNGVFPPAEKYEYFSELYHQGTVEYMMNTN